MTPTGLIGFKEVIEPKPHELESVAEDVLVAFLRPAYGAEAMPDPLPQPKATP